MGVKFLVCLAITYCVYINEINANECLCGARDSDLCLCNTKPFPFPVKPPKKIKIGLPEFEPIVEPCNCCQKIVKPAAHLPKIEWIKDKEPEVEVEVKLVKKEKEYLPNWKLIEHLSGAFDSVLDLPFAFTDKIVPDPFKIMLSKSDDIRLITDALAAYKSKGKGGHFAFKEKIEPDPYSVLDLPFAFTDKIVPDPYKIMLSKSDDIRLITDALAAYKIKEKVKFEGLPESIPLKYLFI